MCASLLKESVRASLRRNTLLDLQQGQAVLTGRSTSGYINWSAQVSIRPSAWARSLGPNPLSSPAFLVKQAKVRVGVTFETVSWLTSRRLARHSGSRLKRDYRRAPPKTLRVAGKLRANHVLLRWATGDEFGVNCSESNFLIKMNITTIGADWDLLLLFLSLSPRLIFSTLQDNLKDSCCFILIGAVM